MTKFKVGDVVECIDVDAYEGLPSGKQGIVSWATDGSVWIKGYGDWCHVEGTLRLVEQDDPLPPAPESAMFREAVTGNTLSVRVREWDGTVEVWSADRGGSVCLSAEETLQLAHDLTRMAMEIKRKEKQRG